MPAGPAHPGEPSADALQDGSILDQLAAALPGRRAGAAAGGRPWAESATRPSSTKCMATAGPARSRPNLVPRRLAAEQLGPRGEITPVNGVDRGAGRGLARARRAAGGRSSDTSTRSAAPIIAGRSPAPSRPACTPGARRSTSTPAYSDYWRWARSTAAVHSGEPHPARDRGGVRAARLHLGRPLVPFRHDALRIPARAARLPSRLTPAGSAGRCGRWDALHPTVAFNPSSWRAPELSAAPLRPASPGFRPRLPPRRPPRFRTRRPRARQLQGSERRWPFG